MSTFIGQIEKRDGKGQERRDSVMSEDGEVVIITGPSDGRLLEMPIKGPREKKRRDYHLEERGSLSLSPLPYPSPSTCLFQLHNSRVRFYGRMQFLRLII